MVLKLVNLREISKRNIVMFNVALMLFNLREISTKNYSDVQRGIAVIQFERDLDKELYYMCVQCGTDVIWFERDLNKGL